MQSFFCSGSHPDPRQSAGLCPMACPILSLEPRGMEGSQAAAFAWFLQFCICFKYCEAGRIPAQ